MNIHTSQEEFDNFLHGLASSQDYRYKLLRYEISQAVKGRSIFYDGSLLNVQGESWILIIHSGAILVYGNNWSKNQFEEIKGSFDLTKFTNYLVTGDSSLIKALLEFYEINNFRIEMERLFYKTTSINIFDSNDLRITPANEKDINILAAMLQQYYHEEYEGENDKTIEDMVSRVRQCIFNETMFVLENHKGDILSFCTIIDPDIGIFFTNTEFRNKGYGKIILSYCADLLLERNTEIYLMTVKSKVDSNTACRRVGFEPYFEYSYTRINNS
jgi:GNAT superfamily N-acetyltransferase